MLNWQSTAIQDNFNTLQRIDGKLDKLVEKTVLTDKKINAFSGELQEFYYDLTQKIDSFDTNLRYLIGQNSFGQEF